MSDTHYISVYLTFTDIPEEEVEEVVERITKLLYDVFKKDNPTVQINII